MVHLTLLITSLFRHRSKQNRPLIDSALHQLCNDAIRVEIRWELKKILQKHWCLQSNFLLNLTRFIDINPSSPPWTWLFPEKLHPSSKQAMPWLLTCQRASHCQNWSIFPTRWTEEEHLIFFSVPLSLEKHWDQDMHFDDRGAPPWLNTKQCCCSRGKGKEHFHNAHEWQQAQHASQQSSCRTSKNATFERHESSSLHHPTLIFNKN